VKIHNPEIVPHLEKVLVLGASGLLGMSVFNAFKKNVPAVGTYFKSKPVNLHGLIQIDLSNRDSAEELVDDLSPTHIVNCFGLTDVEVCEQRPEASWNLNTVIPSHVAKLAFEKNIKFTHISTDHFLSKRAIPRTENDIMIPVNQYGFSKYNAERFILGANPMATILRTNFFGHSPKPGKSILDFAVSNLQHKNKIIGFDDVYFSPVGIEEISKFLTSPISKAACGIVNFAGVESVSKYDFLVTLADLIGAPKNLISRGSIQDSSLKVNRPNYLSLDSSYLRDQLGYEMPNLIDMLRIELDVGL
jgi:dTDP-4-dehydrorhamnose reductase